MFVAGDARQSPFKNLNARLVYADPPTNRGMNAGASTDKLEDFQYQEFAYLWLRNAYANMAWNSRLVVCLHYKIRHIYERMIEKLEGLVYEQEIIWQYNFGLYTRRKFVPSHDNILVYRLGKPPFNWVDVAVESQRLQAGDKRADERGRTPGTVWSIPRVSGNSLDRLWMTGDRRSAQPAELCRRLLLAYTNKSDIVYDPFCGSGTMGVECATYDRKYLGQDICEHYVMEAKKRTELQGWTRHLMDNL